MSDDIAAELAMLASIYCGEREMIVLERSNEVVEFAVHLKTATEAAAADETTEHDVSAHFTLPVRSYPAHAPPLVHVRAPSLVDKAAARALHAALVQHMAVEFVPGAACCYAICEWVRGNAGAHMAAPDVASAAEPEELEFAREFFYFHHLYSEWKRKLMLQWSRGAFACGVRMFSWRSDTHSTRCTPAAQTST